MLAEFINDNRKPPQSDRLPLNEYKDCSKKIFLKLIDFLHDPEHFRNPEVNKLITLLKSLIDNERIPLALDTRSVNSVSFIKVTGVFVMPTNFIDLVGEDPLTQLGLIVSGASLARDFYTGRLSDKPPTVTERAQAFEAEALHTLQQMADNENIAIQWDAYQQELLTTYPDGLKDLPEDYNYPTPVYTG